MPHKDEPAKKDHHSTEKLGYRAHEKKDGAGKGGWGVAGQDDLHPAPAALNSRDPNFPDEEAVPAKQ
eukprot:m51a1_g13927 hypothetical protein (67) ;mRNA; f:832901-833315